MLNVYAITPTGARPEGLALLGEYINAQNYCGKLTWVVVDDCDPVTRMPKMRAGIRTITIDPDWVWRPGMNTQAACMTAGLARVPDDAILFNLEDDDIYLPNHFDNMLEVMTRAELAGERDSRYYNVKTGKWRVLKGTIHASMASTVCRGQALQDLKKLCASGMRKMLDVNLWRNFKGPKMLLDSHNVVGIKGLPGRPGIGVGHRNNFGSVDIDDRLVMWAAQYADNYHIFREAI